MLEDENELLRTHPHLLAYFPVYLLWFWFVAIGVTGVIAGPAIGTSLKGLAGNVPGTSISWKALDPAKAWFLVWAVAVLLPLLVIPLFRISFRWSLAIFLLLGVGGAILALRDTAHGVMTGVLDAGFLQPLWDAVGKPTPNPLHYESVLALCFGMAGVVALEMHRGSRRWILTNRRLIARFGILSKSERDLLYSQVDDIVIHQTLLGSILNFGTVIPLSREGLAANTVESDTRSGVSRIRVRRKGVRVELGNGKRITIPREATFYMLWGVPDPRGKKDLILGEIGKSGGGRAERKPAAPAGTADA